MIWLDDYDRKARLLPGLLAVSPVAICVVALGLRDQPVVVFIGGLLGTIGAPVLLAQTVRVHGLRVEDRLFREWGGPPTTLLLRHRGTQEASSRRAHWRGNVIHATGRGLPSLVEENEDPIGCDGRYAAAVADVRELTRDRAIFPLVFEENRNYGFERNLLGARPMGLCVSAVASLVLAGAVLASIRNDLDLSLVAVGVGLAATVACLAGWLFLPHKDRVREMAFRYAERLLDAAGQVERK